MPKFKAPKLSIPLSILVSINICCLPEINTGMSNWHIWLLPWYSPHTTCSRCSSKNAIPCPQISYCTPATVKLYIWVHFSTFSNHMLSDIHHPPPVLGKSLSVISPNIFRPPPYHTKHSSQSQHVPSNLWDLIVNQFHFLSKFPKRRDSVSKVFLQYLII